MGLSLDAQTWKALNESTWRRGYIANSEDSHIRNNGYRNTQRIHDIDEE